MSDLYCKSILSAMLVIAAPTLAYGGWDDSPLGRAKFGEAWSGPAVTHAALAGQVVLVKSWAEW